MTKRTTDLTLGTLRLLDREPPEDYLRESTARIAAPERKEEVGTHSVLVFRIGVEWLALPTEIFQEVAEDCAIHTVPHRRNGILLGLVNIRGELLPCASLGTVLGLDQLPAITLDERKRRIHSRLLVTSGEGNQLAFPVDEVAGVLRYEPRRLTAVPDTLARAASPFTKGMLPWNGRAVGCLDDELLFYKLNKSFE